jgi:hypothetical protein
MYGASAPRDGTGTVFVRELQVDEFTAIWQGDDDQPRAHIDIDGTRSEVLAWVSRCRAAKFLARDPERGDYVPFTVTDGTIGELPF